MKRVPSQFKKSGFILMVLSAATSAHAQFYLLNDSFTNPVNNNSFTNPVSIRGSTSGYTNSPSPAPVASSNSPGNDVGCPNTSTKTGVYAPCVGYIAPGATSAAGVHHLSAVPGLVVSSMNTQQAAAKGLLPGSLGTPSFGVMVAVSEAGGAGQQNPDSPPPAAPPQPSCAYGYQYINYNAPTWTGWDVTGWNPGSWSYACNPPPPPPQSGGGGGNGPVLCQGSYCIQPDGTITGPVGPNGTQETLTNEYAVIDPTTGDLVVMVVNDPLKPPVIVETFTGVKANTNTGQIEISHAATGAVAGAGAHPNMPTTTQVTSNVTSAEGTKIINIGGGYTYTPSSSGNQQGQLCDSSGNCVPATVQNGVLSATLAPGTTVTANMPTKTVNNDNSSSSSSSSSSSATTYGTAGVTHVIKTTYDPATGKYVSTNVTNAISTPTKSSGGATSSGQ